MSHDAWCEERVSAALGIIDRYGGIDGEYHKQWVLDQLVRILAGDTDEYERWVNDRRNDGYEWGEGIAP